jgi:glycosyltransferase involved in cell wall biosynthesis
VIFPIFVDLEVGVSNYTVELLNQRFVARISRKQAVVIHNAIPIQDGFEKSIPRKSFTSWISDHPIVGSVGRLEVQKGYEFFLDSLPAILLLYPTLEIWLIGDGALRLELEEHCQRLGIYEHIVFWGKQNNISAFLSKMDLFVSSSLYEGLPTVVLEAMVYGVPCVVTDIPGTRDIAMQENVLIVPARDSKALANSISLALNDPHLRKTLMENAIQTIGRFRIDNISLMYLAAYHKL